MIYGQALRKSLNYIFDIRLCSRQAIKLLINQRHSLLNKPPQYYGLPAVTRPGLLA